MHGLAQVRRSVVSHVNGQPMTMVVPSAGIWGTAGIDGLNIDRNIPGRWSRRAIALYTLQAATVRIMLPESH